MKEKKTSLLTSRQKKQAEALISACRQYEPIVLSPVLSSEQNFDPKLPCFFLLSDGDMLLSFLALFLPREDYGEAIAFTHPAARGRGYFTRLWDMALTVLDEAGLLEDMELLLVTDGKSPDAKKALEALDGEYQYGEYFLEKKLSPENSSLDERKDGLSLIGPLPDTEEQIELLSQLHEQIFCDGKRASLTFIKEVLSDESTRTFLLQKGTTLMGLFHLTQTEGRCYLSGFGIHPDFQGMGYGKLMLRLAEKEAFALSSSLLLQTGDYNEAAFSLYKSNGYEETYHLEYYF